ncbi:MAG: STAS domain-containing protein [Desulfotalea sp.]
MKIDFTHKGHIAVASLIGRLDGNAPALLQKEFAIQLEKTSFIIVDCSALEYMDSSGLGALIACLRIAVTKNGDIRLAALAPKLIMLIELTRANKVFPVFPTVEDALASFEDQGDLP